MIRFIDLRGQGTGFRFAFWNTCNDKFCTFDHEQAWDDLPDFLHAVREHGGKVDVVRFTSLMPQWAATPRPRAEPPADWVYPRVDDGPAQFAERVPMVLVDASPDELRAERVRLLAVAADCQARLAEIAGVVGESPEDAATSGLPAPPIAAMHFALRDSGVAYDPDMYIH